MGPQHAPPIAELVVLDGVVASCGPARVNAGPLPAYSLEPADSLASSFFASAAFFLSQSRMKWSGDLQ